MKRKPASPRPQGTKAIPSPTRGDLPLGQVGSLVSKTYPSVLKIGSILVPTDFSAESEKAIAYAALFARQFGAKLTLLHVVEPRLTPDFAKSFPIAISTSELLKNCEHQLKELVKQMRIEPELINKTMVVHGRSFHEIANAARTLKSDLIIISTHGYTGLKHALLGSTAERVVQHAPCMVLVLRSPEFAQT